MAGLGTRFAQAGYELPKPLIDVNGKPMAIRVAENIGIDANYTFIALEEHWQNFNMIDIFSGYMQGKESGYAGLGELCAGAALTVLILRQMIDNDTPLLLANCDQLVDWDVNQFISLIDNADGAIALFNDSDPKWSYADIVDGKIARVAEKEVISNNATTGIYLWKKGSDFVKYADAMVAKGITTNNEYYLCPVYNEAIADGKVILPYFVNAMHGLGTPEDLEAYLAQNSTQG